MRRERSVRAFFHALALGCLMLHALPACVEAQTGGVKVSDRGFLNVVSKQLGIESARLASGQVTLWKLGGAAPALIVFLDGTEVGRFEKDRAEGILSGFPDVRSSLQSQSSGGNTLSSTGVSGSAGSSAVSGNGDSPSWWATQEKDGLWGRLGHWDENLTLGYALDYSFSGVLVRRGRMEAAVVKKFGFLYAGAEVGYHSFKGELPDSVPYAAKAGHFSGGARVGVDFIRYHLQWAPQPLPEYFWTESDLRGKYFSRSTGSAPTKVVKIFENDAPPSLAHSVEARVGAFRYTLTVAPDIYRSPIHSIAFEDLPGFLGTWGLGMVATPDGLIPGGWYRFSPIGVTALDWGEQGIPVSVGLGRISYFGSDRSQFRVAWGGELIFGLRSKEGNRR